MIGRTVLVCGAAGVLLALVRIGAGQQVAQLGPEGRDMLHYASVYSGRPVPIGQAPRIIYLTRESLAGMVCGAPDAECAIEGVYFGGSNVYVLLGLDDMHRRSVIVHEFVHWLQRRTDTPLKARTCLDIQQEEREAYNAQNRYLKDVEHSDDFSYPPVAVCGSR